MELINYEDGKKHGDMKSFYHNGKKNLVGKLVDDKYISFKHYSIHGFLIDEEYQHNEMEIKKSYYQNGAPKKHTCKKGELTLIRDYYINGIMELEYRMKNSELRGLYRGWDNMGNLTTCKFYTHNDVYLSTTISTSVQRLQSFLRKVVFLKKNFNTTIGKFNRILSTIKTREFTEYWYAPNNPGGKRHKSLMYEFLSGIN